MLPLQDMHFSDLQKARISRVWIDKEKIMDSLTEIFNRQANISLIPLWILLLEDIAAIRAKKRSKRIFKLDREFNEKSMKQSRDRYRRQIHTKYTFRP